MKSGGNTQKKDEITLKEFLDVLYEAWEKCCETSCNPDKPTISCVRKEFQKNRNISDVIFARLLTYCYRNFKDTGVMLWGIGGYVARKYEVETIRIDGKYYAFIKCESRKL